MQSSLFPVLAGRSDISAKPIIPMPEILRLAGPCSADSRFQSIILKASENLEVIVPEIQSGLETVAYKTVENI